MKYSFFGSAQIRKETFLSCCLGFIASSYWAYFIIYIFSFHEFFFLTDNNVGRRSKKKQGLLMRMIASKSRIPIKSFTGPLPKSPLRDAQTEPFPLGFTSAFPLMSFREPLYQVTTHASSTLRKLRRLGKNILNKIFIQYIFYKTILLEEIHVVIFTLIVWCAGK